MDEEGAGLKMGEGVPGPCTLQPPEEGPGQRGGGRDVPAGMGPTLGRSRGRDYMVQEKRGHSCAAQRQTGGT